MNFKVGHVTLCCCYASPQKSLALKYAINSVDIWSSSHVCAFVHWVSLCIFVTVLSSF